MFDLGSEPVQLCPQYKKQKNTRNPAKYTLLEADPHVQGQMDSSCTSLNASIKNEITPVIQPG